MSALPPDREEEARGTSASGNEKEAPPAGPPQGRRSHRTEPQSGEPSSPPSSGRGLGGKPINPRRRARELAIQGLYQWQVGGQDEAAVLVQSESAPGFDKADGELFKALIGGVMAQDAALRELLVPHIARNWNEVSPIERSVLLLAACELRFHPETPYRVIINEAIELAKTFGGTDGHKFVNGVLDKLAPVLRPQEATRNR
ncbi:hypothetical protein B9N43_12020 [Denitratisoma sp. DHT3]|uniref:transcription antitermination factor NusB n=1 Tax=Denitratisoma sp. DHT3 TaxID=1981880 RepID=UPI0011986053|nr:transcription antitermination factor NusB [Denitratisoma sp. DHT3]QDX81916.1 hypothetical protein B9N43_12020 [Denitratisoma sp. DHT3]